MNAKRLFDIAISGTALVVASPLLAALAVAVKVDSPGPVLFVQQRIGRGKRPIRIAKLRTMVADAEHNGPAVTAARDPRITRVGAFLRRTKLDELPQLWNVLCGDMSIVGPRPEVPRYVAAYPPEWDRVFDVRPGLTDLASIVFRDEELLLATASDRERAYSEVVLPMKIALALRTVEQSSVRHDLEVIARTALAIVRPGSYGADLLAEARRRITTLTGEA
jgi:lipopolysaccharide/colanic/teichoic acid biosynthesis glycosyltransferase